MEELNKTEECYNKKLDPKIIDNPDDKEDKDNVNNSKDNVKDEEELEEKLVKEKKKKEVLRSEMEGRVKEEEGSAKEKWTARQDIEILSGTSSSEETPPSPTKVIRRRKKKPRDISEAAQSRQKKMNEILAVLSSSPLDMEALRELAISDGGLVKDEIRRRAWPILMMMEHIESAPKPPLEVVKAHKYYQQVVLDVQRTLQRFPPGIDDDYRVVLMDQLIILIIRVLMKHPHLHYYQGYHDVAITFLLVMGEDIGYEMMEKLSVTHLCEFMRPNMERTMYYLTYLYPILHRADPQLYKFIDKCGVGTNFCLPWLITWFAHTLADYRNVVRLYDFFLASPYLMPMYIATAIVLQKKEEVLAGECDDGMQHGILSQVPDTLPFEDILVEARQLYKAYPPDTLTQEVEEHIKKRAEEEKQERQRLLERKKKYLARNNNNTLIATVLSFIPVAPAHRVKVVKIVLFAASVFVARSLYSYYSTSGLYVTLDT